MLKLKHGDINNINKMSSRIIMIFFDCFPISFVDIDVMHNTKMF